MKVYFENSKGKRRVIGEDANTSQEVMKIIQDFLDEHNYKSYYTRMWCKDGWTRFDVGSHTEFFLCDEEIGFSEEDFSEED